MACVYRQGGWGRESELVLGHPELRSRFEASLDTEDAASNKRANLCKNEQGGKIWLGLGLVFPRTAIYTWVLNSSFPSKLLLNRLPPGSV